MSQQDIIMPVGNAQIQYKGKIIQIVHQEMKRGEKKKIFEYAERAPGVRILIVNSDGTICLTKEWRVELNNGEGGWDFRLPGGKVFNTLAEYNQYQLSGGNILEAAKNAVIREAEEEVGITPLQVEYLHTSSCGATMHWDLFYFLVCDFEEHINGQNLGFSENIEVLRLSPETVKQKCLAGHIQEDRTVAVLLRYLTG